MQGFLSLAMKKRILIYAHYYAPDVASTGQILQNLAEGMTDEFDVTVICTVPSYTGTIEKSYRDKRFYKEDLNGVSVIRIRVPDFSKTSKISRIRNLLSYYIGARKATGFVGNQDYVFAISQPPILGGMLGVYGKRKLLTTSGRQPKLIYNIHDFNPEQIEAVGYIKIKPILSIALSLDKRSCRESDLVITVGRDLAETLKNRFEGSEIPRHVVINNWADETKLFPLKSDDPGVEAFKKQYGLVDKFVFMYSGNLGLYYDLIGIIQVIAKFIGAKTPDGRNVVFVFVGSGSVLEELKKYKIDHSLDNVIFVPYQEKENLVYSLNAADVHFCLSARGIKGISCPSKFYGSAAVGKSVLGVLEKGSEVEMLINETGCGVVSDPGDYDVVKRNIQMFIDNSCNDSLYEMGAMGRDYFVQYLAMEEGIKKYKRTILELED